MLAVYLFLAGAGGFFVFDAYRMYSHWVVHKQLFLTFGHVKGQAAHLVVYTAAGVLGLFINLDACFVPASEVSLHGPSGGLFAAALIRSFSVGVLGPAGLSRAHSRIESGALASKEQQTADDTPVSTATFGDYVRYLLMR